MTTASQTPSKGWSRLGALGLGIGAIIMWIGSRMPWIDVAYQDDKSGPGSIALSGSSWSTEITAVILVLLAGMIAAFVVRRWGRRIIGVIGALAAFGVVVSPIAVLLGNPDAERAKLLLTSGAASQRSNAPVTIAEWAEITGISVQAVGPIVATLGALVAVAAGIGLALKPGGDSPKMNKYETATMRREKLEDDLDSTPDSGRVMWDALDADIDPTDRNG
ncbi:TIGR02234 family membrane protein [Corynebacterium cystitidis]|uniref:TIGR02234 family membrane protein n=1 Tax=Corynebacterium cystitidis TaxID=35757 RepID=UPI00211E9439|nr:TIGR02234 family membrane protein [Corynebacterium cystitidis]